MERYDKVLAEINISTSELNIKAIQDVLKLSKENSNTNKDFWNKVSEILWSHLQTGFKTFDDQLLCATCFFTVVPLTDKQDVYVNELLQIINRELYFKINREKSAQTSTVASMMYGMFQSTFLTQKMMTPDDIYKIVPVLISVFDLLLMMGYEYSQFTFITFKTISLFKKVQGFVDFRECIFNKQKQSVLLDFVNHNWENPVTGIRDLNRSIFQTLISIIDAQTYDTVVKQINGFYWNKAKYLMLSEIIELRRGSILALINENQWVGGLIYSLHKPGLVSAGADMYYALLKHINSEKDWCELFQYQVIQILNGNSSKAIENFKNFWCLITMKKFPSLPYILLDELKDQNNSEQNLCSQLSIMKQANKLGIIEKKWSSPEDFGHIEHTVMNGIEHCNNNIRMLAFDIVCVSHRKLVPSQLEYDLILNFINNNVNSDCTVLRLSMLNSLNYFLTQLHSIFLIMKSKNESTEELKDLLEFCYRLQSLVIKSLNLNGNYQRKITSVKLCNTILSCYSGIPSKKRGQTRHANITLMEYVKEQRCWIMSTEDFVVKLVSLLKDPTDDVRENVIKLLLNHYSEELKEPNITQHLVEGALKSMKSKFFYETSCGQSMFKLLTNLVIKDKHSIVEYKSVEDIFYFAYNELIVEHRAKTNIMKSIETGKQLHSFMNILLVVLENCISNSYKIDIEKIMPEFVEVLESISNQFAWEEESSTSSDFSKMSDMVESIIDSSGLSSGEKADETKISGLHQIVLNSLWLNVKASCDLASILVQLNKDDASMCKRCLNIITHVLETSRHKGAIEAAGASLGKGIQFLSSLPEENKASEVPSTLLRCKLNDLISETNKMASITRRGAGLSIMVHRIVSSDMTKGKPLFHYFMNTLLEICDTSKDTPKKNNENQVDIPKAIYIHFMTRIVNDSSLASDIMFYFTKLAELAFSNLTSHHWQIRNAALQLYGALIPKQIGEKKASGSDEQTTATVSCDELRTHSPKLWIYIMEQLEDEPVGPDLVQTQSDIVPILNLLANSAKRYSFSSVLMEQMSVTNKLFNNLVVLLNSPIHTVRRLAAKCIFNILSFEQISEKLWILNNVCITENFVHGSFIMLQICHKYYSSHQAYKEHFERFKDFFQVKFSCETHSYLSRKIYEDIFITNYKFEDIERTILELNNMLSYIPGVDLWAESRLRKYIINTSAWDEIPALINIISKQSNREKYCEFICMKVKTQECQTDVLLKVVEGLLAFEKKYSSCIIWEILYNISLKTNLCSHLDTAELLKILQERESVYIVRYIIPLLARNIANMKTDDKLSLMKIIRKFCDFENSDVEMRCIAAIANNELANEFYNLPDSMKVTSIQCAVMLLQDEDEDARLWSVNFYHRLSKHDLAVQPYICLNNILSHYFLSTNIKLSQHLINELVKEISEILQSNHSTDQYNPFANESKNIYLEPDVLKQLIENLHTA